MNTKEYLRTRQTRINNYLDNILPNEKRKPHKLHAAMRYSVLNGGKRLRPLLLYAVGESLNAPPNALNQCSAAIELIHSFSLVHDDLPAIDNDELRRGKPSCHVAFDEATAILCGDALLVLSFKILASMDKSITAKNKLTMIQLLTHCIGSAGMAGGEALDSADINKRISLKQLTSIYKLKTSYLIAASVLLGALCANCTNKTILRHLQNFGINIGLAFQIHDDIIGIESDTKTLGKPQGSDIINNKPTYPKLLGLKISKKEERKYFENAIGHLKNTPINTEKLIAISEYIINRKM